MVNAQEWLDNNYPKNGVYRKQTNDNFLLSRLKEVKETMEKEENSEEWDNEGKTRKEITKLNINNYMGRSSFSLTDSLDLSDFENLEELDCSYNQLTNINLSNCRKLTKLNCRNNNLVSLDLSDCQEITNLKCQKNKFTNLNFLQHLDSEKLISLKINDNNFPESDLTPFSRFINLKTLRLGTAEYTGDDYNHFRGSLKPLNDLIKLKELDISNTDIYTGLEYLPESIEKFITSGSRPSSRVKELEKSLMKVFATKSSSLDFIPFTPKFIREATGSVAKSVIKTAKSATPKSLEKFFSVYSSEDLKHWREIHPDEVEEAQKTIKSEKIKKKAEEREKIAPFMPLELRRTWGKEKLDETFINKEEDYTYSRIYLEINSPWLTHKVLSPEKLPSKLYNVENGQIEKIEELPDIEDYAILSYVWGENRGNEKLSQGGKKSLDKAVEVCRHIGIKYLWIDQLCINQKDNDEKAQEVKKMRQYYGNATVTLVAIQANVKEENDPLEILKKIINSQWFSRSWTFQEGWLSKQTIFMFDDKLVDGRKIAGHWVLEQPSYSENARYFKIREVEEGLKKIATPVGWVYFKERYSPEDTISLSLSQLLRETKERGKGIPVDGIYSILGLLPYGEKVTVDYSEENTPQKALLEVMKEAVKAGYGEPLAWFGPSNNLPGKCWMPKIIIDGKDGGSTSVEGGIEIKVKFSSENLPFEEKGIKINGSQYTVDSIYRDSMRKLEKGFLVDGGFYEKDVSVKFENNNAEYQYKKITLRGTQKTLENIEEDNVFIMPNENEWKSNTSFALLVKRKGSEFHRVDLLELIGNVEELKEAIKRDWVIGMDKQINQIITTYQHQSQIQIPPK